MRLRDIYMKKHFQYSPKSFFNNEQGRTSGWDVINWNFAYLNSVHVPSENQIIAAQKTAALAHIMTTHNRNALAQINADLQMPLAFDPAEAQKFITLIEQALETSGTSQDAHYALGWLKPKNGQTAQKLINTLRRNEAKFAQTLLMLKQIYAQFSKLNEQSMVPFPKKVQTQLSNLSNVIAQLEADLQAIKAEAAPSIDISSRLSKTTGQMGYLQRTQNIGWELKGFLLPLLGIQHYNQYLEQTGRYFIDTGAWRDKRGKEIPVDIIGVSNLSISFSGTIDGVHKNIPLSKVVEAMEKAAKNKDTISIEVDDWDMFLQNLKKNNAHLIQSKAGRRTPVLNNRFKISLDDIVNNRSSRESHALARLQSLKRYYSARIYTSHEYYNALFSYELSKYMQNIIGVENNIILTPQGFQTLDVWVQQEFVSKYYRPVYLSLNSSSDIQLTLK